jgi:ankyrin repeat protein
MQGSSNVKSHNEELNYSILVNNFSSQENKEKYISFVKEIQNFMKAFKGVYNDFKEAKQSFKEVYQANKQAPLYNFEDNNEPKYFDDFINNQLVRLVLVLKICKRKIKETELTETSNSSEFLKNIIKEITEIENIAKLGFNEKNRIKQIIGSVDNIINIIDNNCAKQQDASQANNINPLGDDFKPSPQISTNPFDDDTLSYISPHKTSTNLFADDDSKLSIQASTNPFDDNALFHKASTNLFADDDSQHSFQGVSVNPFDDSLSLANDLQFEQERIRLRIKRDQKETKQLKLVKEAIGKMPEKLLEQFTKNEVTEEVAIACYQSFFLQAINLNTNYGDPALILKGFATLNKFDNEIFLKIVTYKLFSEDQGNINFKILFYDVLDRLGVSSQEILLSQISQDKWEALLSLNMPFERKEEVKKIRKSAIEDKEREIKEKLELALRKRPEIRKDILVESLEAAIDITDPVVKEKMIIEAISKICKIAEAGDKLAINEQVLILKSYLPEIVKNISKKALLTFNMSTGLLEELLESELKDDEKIKQLLDDEVIRRYDNEKDRIKTMRTDVLTELLKSNSKIWNDLKPYINAELKKRYKEDQKNRIRKMPLWQVEKLLASNLKDDDEIKQLLAKRLQEEFEDLKNNPSYYLSHIYDILNLAIIFADAYSDSNKLKEIFEYIIKENINKKIPVFSAYKENKDQSIFFKILKILDKKTCLGFIKHFTIIEVKELLSTYKEYKKLKDKEVISLLNERIKQDEEEKQKEARKKQRKQEQQDKIAREEREVQKVNLEAEMKKLSSTGSIDYRVENLHPRLIELRHIAIIDNDEIRLKYADEIENKIHNWRSPLITIEPEESQIELHNFVKKGDLKGLSEFLENMTSYQIKLSYLNNQDRYGKTPLHYAAEKNNGFFFSQARDMTKILLRHGANPNIYDSQGYTALHIAAQFGCLKTIRALFNSNVRVDLQDFQGNTALHLAVQNNKRKTSRALLERGANPYIANNQNKTVLEFGLEQNRKFFDFLVKKARSDYKFADSVNEEGKSDSSFFSLMKLAIKNKVPNSVFKILAKDYKEPKFNLKSLDENKNTVLHLAVQNNDPKLLNILLKAASKDIINLANSEGDTALDLAIKSNLVEAFKELVKAGANIEARNLKNQNDSSVISLSQTETEAVLTKKIQERSIKASEFLKSSPNYIIQTIQQGISEQERQINLKNITDDVKNDEKFFEDKAGPSTSFYTSRKGAANDNLTHAANLTIKRANNRTY